MKKLFPTGHWISRVFLTCLFALGVISSHAAQPGLTPPAQDYYLHTNQRIHDRHELAWVETPGSLIVSNALTVEAWVYWEGTDLTETDELTNRDRQQMTLFCGQHAYGFYHDAKHLGGWVFMLQTGAPDSIAQVPVPLPLREWAHLAASWDGTTIKTYLNGVQQSDTTQSGIIPVVGDAFEWECSYTLEPELAPASDVFGIGLGQGFTGGIRQLRVWNRALDQQQIAFQINAYDLEIEVRATHIAHVSRHTLAGKHAAWRLALTDRARCTLHERGTMRSAPTAEVMALDRSGEALADRHALDIHSLSGLEDINPDLGARFEVCALAGLEAEFPQSPARRDPGLGKMSSQRLANAIGAPAPDRHLDGRIPVLLHAFHLGHAVGSDLEHGYRYR